jgi:hypothetical protein
MRCVSRTVAVGSALTRFSTAERIATTRRKDSMSHEGLDEVRDGSLGVRRWR